MLKVTYLPKAGTGKTFLLTTLCTVIRAKGLIVVVVGSTGLAASMYMRGTTAHSAFNIPLNDPLNTMFHRNKMYQDSDFWKQVSIIVWDELPMSTCSNLEYVSIILQDIRKDNSPFGGIVFVGCGDWRQVGPVIPGGGLGDIIDASPKSSELWTNVTILRLSISVRQQNDQTFESWIDQVGDGLNREEDLSRLQTVFTTEDAFNALFPDHSHLDSSTSYAKMYLSPINAHADDFNNYVLEQFPGMATTYYSSNSMKEQGDSEWTGLPRESLFNQAEGSGVPRHTLKLKVGVICFVMRNLSFALGIVKNSRIRVMELHQRHVVVETIARAGYPSKRFAITRIYFEFKENSFTGYSILRRQIPLRLAYGCSFNGCQSATAEKVVIDVRTPVFSHGQLYTAMSRVRKQNDLIIRRDFDLPEQAIVRNVVAHSLIC
jgi:hypothetical protein